MVSSKPPIQQRLGFLRRCQTGRSLKLTTHFRIGALPLIPWRTHRKFCLCLFLLLFRTSRASVASSSWIWPADNNNTWSYEVHYETWDGLGGNLWCCTVKRNWETPNTCNCRLIYVTGFRRNVTLTITMKYCMKLIWRMKSMILKNVCKFNKHLISYHCESYKYLILQH